MESSAAVDEAGNQLPAAVEQSMPGLVAVGKPGPEFGASPGAVPVSVKLYVVDEVAEGSSGTWPTKP